MDSAEAERLSEILRTQEARLNRQEEFQAAMAANMGQITSQMQDLLGQLSRSNPVLPTPPPAALPDVPAPSGGATCKLAPPTQYTGEPGLCRTFMIDCSIHFEFNPQAFSTERAKVAFMISHLGGRAKAWASAEWSRNSSTCETIAGFQAALTKTFDPVCSNREKAQELSLIRQGNQSVCDYAIHFRTLAAESGWNNTALYDIFLKGLSSELQDLLVPLDLPTTLDALIALAIRTDNRRSQLLKHREIRRGESYGATAAPETKWPTPLRGTPENTVSRNDEEPMQLGRTRLTPEERQKRRLEGRCFYCGEAGHLVSTCPVKKHRGVSSNQVSKTAVRVLTKVMLNSHFEMEAMIDSGADESLMDWNLARKLQIDCESLERPIRARSLNGADIFVITHVSKPVQMNIGRHQEHIQFHLFTSTSHALILGQPWLFLHNPHIDWKSGQVKGWGEECANHYDTDPVAEINLFSADPITDPEYPDLTSVPSCYHHLKEVFNKTKALSLPPHRPYDCAIDLIPGSTIPKGRLYSISGPERQAMNDYISASLKAGLIRPSSSPAGAGFFFVDKKDGSLSDPA